MNGTNDFLIMRPFNALFFTIFAALLLLLIMVSLALRGKSEELKKKIIVTVSLLTLAGFAVYKYFLSIDADYDILMQSQGGFDWWCELPLQLCNINMILIPIAVLLDKKELMAFCFFVGPLGASMALMMPLAQFDGFSILLPRMLGYYGTHFFIVIEGLALVTFGLYRPRLKDLPRIIPTVFIVAFCIFMFNMILRWTGISPRANYFYSVETEGNFLLEIFHSWIPVPFLYLLPCILILIAYMAVIMTGFTIADKIKEKRS